MKGNYDIFTLHMFISKYHISDWIHVSVEPDILFCTYSVWFIIFLTVHVADNCRFRCLANWNEIAVECLYQMLQLSCQVSRPPLSARARNFQHLRSTEIFSALLLLQILWDVVCSCVYVSGVNFFIGAVRKVYRLVVCNRCRLFVFLNAESVSQFGEAVDTSLNVISNCYGCFSEWFVIQHLDCQVTSMQTYSNQGLPFENGRRSKNRLRRIG